VIEGRFLHVREQGTRGKDTGVIEGKVQSTVGFDCGGDEILDLLRATDIRLNKKGSPTFPLNPLNCLATSWAQVADDHPGAVPRKEQGCGAPDPGAATSDDNYFAIDVRITTVLTHAKVDLCKLEIEWLR
jgi:hypothetical protein